MPFSTFAVRRGAHAVRAFAAAALFIGYADLVRGGVTFGPLLLVAGYMVFVPLALLAE